MIDIDEVKSENIALQRNRLDLEKQITNLNDTILMLQQQRDVMLRQEELNNKDLAKLREVIIWLKRKNTALFLGFVLIFIVCVILVVYIVLNVMGINLPIPAFITEFFRGLAK